MMLPAEDVAVAGTLGLAGLVAGVVAGVSGVVARRRQKAAAGHDTAELRAEIGQKHEESMQLIAHLTERLDACERGAQASLEMLRDGRLGMPARAKALRMLRTGMATDTIAGELGLARMEVRLLGKVGALFAPQN